ncbi:Phosphonates import ATP-binding protein PhnC [Bienertia sinuspersici]
MKVALIIPMTQVWSLSFSILIDKIFECIEPQSCFSQLFNQDLRLRITPNITRLSHLLAHSLASNAALALQLNFHSSTRHEEIDLIEEILNNELQKAQPASTISGYGRSLRVNIKSKWILQMKMMLCDLHFLKMESKKKELREKALGKQIHCLTEQLAAKNARVEALSNDTNVKSLKD